ncbi:MAG: hypothetical protein OEO77_06705 [Acidimicrobiia bacterium]|nr:hypothetical protein [Acidimicrobiia bacterium]
MVEWCEHRIVAAAGDGPTVSNPIEHARAEPDPGEVRATVAVAGGSVLPRRPGRSDARPMSVSPIRSEDLAWK